MMLAIEDLSQFVWSASLLFAGYLVVTVFVLPHPFFSSTTRYLDSQSWAGLQKQQWFSRLRASVRSLTKTRAMVVEGYEKFSKTGKNWALAQFLSDPIIILPAQRLHEVMALSDEQLDHHGPNANSFVPRYSTGEDVVDGPHIDVVRRQLTRRLPLLTADVHEELALAMEQNWTPKEEWTTVAAYESVMKIVSRAANRVFCGTELCRNPEFLEASRQFAIGAFGAGFKLKMFPKWTHPIAGPLAALPVTRSLAIAKRICTPIIKERLRHIQDPALAKDYEAPNDALQWLLEDLVKRAGPDLKIDMDQTIRQLMMLNMVAIHTTSMVTTNTLLDLYSHPDAAMYVAGLREECERVFATEQKWSKDAVNKLIRVDSVIRETMRITTLADFSLKRSVKSPAGVTLANGTHVPHGVTIAFTNYAIHQDPTFYPDNPDKWDGFRFSAPRERDTTTTTTSSSSAAPAPPVAAAADLSKILEQKNQNLTAIGPDFLSFGLGRHACPGRFFASQEMKLMLAHIVMNFDVRVVGGKRPANDYIAEHSMPSEKAQIEIRLREK